MKRRDHLDVVGPWALGLIAAVLLLTHLHDYPAPWFDEGLNLSTAAMIARQGTYALPDSRGPRVMDPAIQTGPTVLLPVALVVRLFGTKLTAARLVVVAFALLALWLYWRLARRLFGAPTALVASLCLLAGNPDRFASFVYMGRQVLGEVPALAFVLLGLVITLESWERPGGRRRDAVLAGLAWGAAMVTKSQIFVLLPAAIALVCAADLLYFRQRVWRRLAISAAVGLACVAAWYSAQFLLAGAAQFQQNAAVAREGFTLHIVNVEIAHMRNAAGVVWRSGFLLWGLPGLFWGLHLARRRNERGLQHLLALALPAVALAWFAGFSIGWSRYAFFPFVLFPMWTANGLVELAARRLVPHRSAAAGIVAGLLLVPLLVIGALPWARGVVAPPANGYEAMRAFLTSNVPAGAVVETCEWEFGVEAALPMRHPTMRTISALTEAIYGRRAVPATLLSEDGPLPDFVLAGPFSGWTGMYRDLLESRGTRVATFDPYALYRIRRDGT